MRAVVALGFCAVAAGCNDASVSANETTGVDVPIELVGAGLGEWICQPGELRLEDGSCLPAGISPEDCAAGFAPTGDRSCTPILPTADCAPGSMALPGERSCRAVAPCAPGIWGDIPVDADTEHVDASHTGASDGGPLAPWTTIQAAVDAAVDGAIVAIAEGTYAEQIVVQKRVRLWGRCPDLVEIAGTSNSISIQQGGDGSEVRDLAISASSGVGLHVGGSTGVVIDRVWVHDAQNIGIDIEGGNPEATVTRSLVENVPGIGVFGHGSTIAVEDTVVRDILPILDGGFPFGHGMRVFDDDAGVPTTLEVRRSLIHATYDKGISGFGSQLTVEDSVVRDVTYDATDASGGQAIYARESDFDAHPSALSVTGSLVEQSYRAGIYVLNSGVAVERTVVRHIQTAPGEQGSAGILVLRNESPTPSQMGVRSMVVEDTSVCGILAVDSDGTVEAVLVRDTRPMEMPGTYLGGGRGICIEGNAKPEELHALAVRGCRVERVHEIGVAGLAADLAVESTLVSDVAGRASDGFSVGITIAPNATKHIRAGNGHVRDSLVESVDGHGILFDECTITIDSTWVREVGRGGRGFGIGVQGHYFFDHPAAATIRRSLIEGASEVGLSVIGADVSIDRSIIRDTRTNSAGLLGDGIGVSALGLLNMVGTLADFRPAKVDINDTVVEGNARVGVGAFGASVTMGRSLLNCNSIDISGEAYSGSPFAFADGGDNTCTCSADARPCRVTSAGLTPPDPVQF